MKMGWKEGEGLGSESQGIKAPVNKYAPLSERGKTLSLSSLSPFHMHLYPSSFLLHSSVPPSHIASLSSGGSQPRTGQVLGLTAPPS